MAGAPGCSNWDEEWSSCWAMLWNWRHFAVILKRSAHVGLLLQCYPSMPVVQALYAVQCTSFVLSYCHSVWPLGNLNWGHATMFTMAQFP